MNTAKIRELNDQARQTLSGCRVMVTQGIQQLDQLDTILSAVREFNNFNSSNDPYGEHDFGKIELFGEAVFWKFDYYDLALEYGSEDPSDSAVTIRMLTIMLASEY
jgi:Protein of unknown function (DUF3768)